MSNKNKQSNTYVILTVGAGIALAGIFTMLSMQTFSKVPMIVASQDIEPYSTPVTAEHFKQIQVTKADRKEFSEFAMDYRELIGKVPTSAIVSGQPVKSSQFVNPESAADLQNVIVDPDRRGIYISLDFDGALSGDLKAGGVYDFYIVATIPNPTPDDEDNETKFVLPLQKSYKIKKLLKTEDGTRFDVFFEFPSEESEEYILLKTAVADEDMQVIATMPGAVHEVYDGELTDLDTFLSKYFLFNENNFTSVSQLESANKNEANTVVSGVISNNQAKPQDKVEQTENKPESKPEGSEEKKEN